MDIKKYTEQNRAAWNEAMPLHQKARGNSAAEQLSDPDYYGLDEIAIGKLREIVIEGKHVAQICCNNGIETISLKKLGAASCVGFDISDEAIKEAVALADSVNIPVTFVRTDVYDISEQYNAQFDFVYISIGVLGWMPDLVLFFEKVVNVLKDGGQLMIYEMHPMIDVFDEESREVKYSYFNKTPFVENDGIDYVGDTVYESETKYWFPHTMSDIIQGLIGQGVVLKQFVEMPHDISTVAGRLESDEVQLPLSFILVGEKGNK